MEDKREIKVWDPLVRLFHWGLVAAFAVSWLTAESDYEFLHTGAGYTILGLVAFRLVWGLIGPRHARFSEFVKGPRAAIQYLKDLVFLKAPAYIGHNPAAGMMVIALLVSLVVTGVSGMMLYGADDQAGPLAASMAPYGYMEDALEEVHEFFAGFTLALVGLHVIGIMVSSLAHGENLVRAMVTGKKRVGSHPAPDGPGSGHRGGGSPLVARTAVGLGVAVLLLAAAAQAAPVSALDERLDAYRSAGAASFSVDAGQALWERTRMVDGKVRQCSSCHTADLKVGGSHVETGKKIDPLAPSANAERLTD
ncbi:MAG: cytochrome b/b6 domain-containing protein, partial [Leptospirillia bacterium]